MSSFTLHMQLAYAWPDSMDVLTVWRLSGCYIHGFSICCLKDKLQQQGNQLAQIVQAPTPGEAKPVGRGPLFSKTDVRMRKGEAPQPMQHSLEFQG